MNTQMDNYIDSLKDGDVIDYYGIDYTISEQDAYGCTLIPAFQTEDLEEEIMKVTWSDIAEQTDLSLFNN